MLRTSSALLLGVLAPGLLLLTPTASSAAAEPGPGAPAPRPVAATVVELPVRGIAPAAAAEPVDGALRAVGRDRRTVLLTDRRGTADYGLVGVTWRRDPVVRVVEAWARTRTAGAWSPWTLVGAQADEEPDAAEAAGVVRVGTTPLWVGRADGVQVRVDVLSGPDPQDLRIALVDPGDSPADQTVAEPSTTPSSAGLRAAGAPVVRSRADWGADESMRRAAPSYASTVRAVVVHHTASTNDYAPSDVPRLLRGFYAYHVKSQGWSDLGYNLLVDRFGTVWEGRAGGTGRAVIGAHAGGFNTGTVGVSMIGTYESVAPSAVQRESLAQVAAWRLSSAGGDPLAPVRLTSAGGTRWPSGMPVTLPTVLGHRQVSSTSCPGTLGFAALAGVRARTAALLGGAAPTAGVLQVVAPSSAAAGSSVDLSVRGGTPGAPVQLLLSRRDEPVSVTRRTGVLSAWGTYRTTLRVDEDWTVLALSGGTGSLPTTVRRRPVSAAVRAYPAPSVWMTGPVTADTGSSFQLTARGVAGRDVSIWTRREGTDEFTRRSTGRFDASGHFTDAVRADRPYDWFAVSGGTASTVGSTGTGPVPDGLHVYAPVAATAGRTVALVVQGDRGAAVQVWFARRGETAFTRRREGVLGADGTYRTSYVAHDDQVVFATSGGRSSTRRTIRTAGTRTPSPPALSRLSLTAPARADAGAAVPVVVTGAPGAPVELWTRARGAVTFGRVASGAFDATGRFATSYAGVDDHELWASSAGSTTPDATTLALPVLSAPANAPLGSRVGLVGRARPGDVVVVEARRRGAAAPTRTTVRADTAGAFRGTFVVDGVVEHRPEVGTRIGALRRTTVSPTTVGPAVAVAGSTVTVTGTARPGATVEVLFRRDAPSAQVASRQTRPLPLFRLGRTLVADPAGRWTTRFVLAGRHSYYARADGSVSPTRTTSVQ